jgi:hypothetical protein
MKVYVKNVYYTIMKKIYRANYRALIIKHFVAYLISSIFLGGWIIIAAPESPPLNDLPQNPFILKVLSVRLSFFRKIKIIRGNKKKKNSGA